MELKINASTILERDGKILLVQEGKKELFQKWNLPGGGLKSGEEIVAGAKRETLEEASVDVEIIALLGLYPVAQETHSFNFVFYANIVGGNPAPADDILQCKWFGRDEIEAFEDSQIEIVGSLKLRKIFADYFEGIKYPLSVITEIKK